MATLSKNGDYIIVELTSKKKAYCSNNKVLVNRGDGWKVLGKLRKGLDYREAAQKQTETIESKIKNNPSIRAWKKIIMQYKLSERVKILSLLSLLGDDLDGLWSELNIYGSNYTLEETKEIWEAYRKALGSEKKS